MHASRIHKNDLYWIGKLLNPFLNTLPHPYWAVGWFSTLETTCKAGLFYIRAAWKGQIIKLSLTLRLLILFTEDWDKDQTCYFINSAGMHHFLILWYSNKKLFTCVTLAQATQQVIPTSDYIWFLWSNWTSSVSFG